MQAARFWKYVVVVAALGVMAGCSDDDNNGNDEGSLTTEEDELTLTDAQIARVLEVANEGEVMLSQLALERGTASAVRDFGDRMVREHTAAQQRLASLLQNEGLEAVDSPLSTQLQDEVQRMITVLRNVEAERFDLAFMDAQVAVHASVAMVGDSLLTPQVQNQALAQELRTQRVDVQTHLQDAASIQAGLFK